MTRLQTRLVSLIGPRCSGKTSVGERLAHLVGVGFCDLDTKIVELHAKETGRTEPSAGAILTELGHESFRQLEARALRQALASEGEWVIATGGGVVELGGNRRLLRERTTCVRLVAPAALLRERLAHDSTPRPALLGDDPLAEIESVLEKREPLYAEPAHYTIDCGTDDVEVLALRVQALVTARS